MKKNFETFFWWFVGNRLKIKVLNFLSLNFK